MTRYLYFFILLCFSISLFAQSDKPLRRYALEVGLLHHRQLDQHASPLIYQLTAPQLGLGVDKAKNNYYWQIQLQLAMGSIKSADKELYRFQSIGNWHTSMIGLRSVYLRKRNEYVRIGAAMYFDLGIDFDGIATFPWSTGQGYLGPAYQKTWQRPQGDRWQLQLSAPVLGLVIRQPYHFIPRREGEVPGVASLLAKGTKVVSWNSYQRVDAMLHYQHSLNERWALSGGGRFSWFRYADPAPITAYRGTLFLKLSRNF